MALLLITLSTQAFPYAYLDDANVQTDAPLASGDFPKVMLTETQSLAGTAEQFSKYDVIGVKSGMLDFVEDVQARNANVRLHFGFSPRAYQGFSLDDPCSLAQGLTFEVAGPATENCQVYPGHWLYFAGTTLTSSISATTKTLAVADASTLEAGQYVVIYDPPAGSFENAEHARVQSIDKSSVPHKVTLSVRGYKSTAKFHPKNAIIAQHVLGRGGDAPQNWSYNQTLNSPVDAKGRSIGEAMLTWLEDNLGKTAKGTNSGARVDGIYFDADPYFNDIEADRLDGDNDLVGDRLFSAAGVNLWGEGMEDFYAQVRQRFPALTIAGGMRRTRGFDDLNGVQMEGWPVSGSYEAVIPDYGHADGNDGFDSMLQRYLVHLQYHNTSSSHVENLSKSPTKLYPEGVSGVTSNAAFRFGLGSTLLGDGFYGQQNSAHHPDPWYDEYAVDVVPGSPTYGHAAKSNPNNESAVLAHKGWLGQPLGPHYRVYDDATFAASKSKVANGGFESGTTGWTFKNLDTNVVTNTAMEGARSLKIIGHSTYSPETSGAKILGPAVSLTKGKQYTLAFSAKAAGIREITVRVQGARNIYLVPNRWTRIVHTFTATQSGNFKPSFMLGREDVPTWLDAVYLFEGNANVFMREFDNGVVVVNATPTQRTVDLGETFLRIKGTGQDAINDGSAISAVSIAAYDAAILVRPESDTTPVEPPAPTPSPSPASGCGAPEFEKDATPRVYVWNDTCFPRKWWVRATQNAKATSFTGTVQTSNGTLNWVTGRRLESNDELNLSADQSTLDFNLIIGNGIDEFSFNPPISGGLCLTVDSPAGTQVLYGNSAVAAPQSVDLRTGGACSL